MRPSAYTSEQLSAITAAEQNLQVIAAAGSGKTQVMAERVSHLLGIGTNTPASVVAFTFTEKAATELKHRIYRVVRRDHGDLSGMAELFIGTMHAYALDLLQTHLYRFLKYSVLTEVQTRLFINRFSRESGLTTVPVHSGPSAGQMLRRGSDTKLFMQLLGILREDEVDRDKVPGEVAKALASYENLLHENRYFDYTGILTEAVNALEGTRPLDEPLRAYVRSTVHHVIVDEYQDVNPLQERLIKAMNDLGAVVSVVGDDDQTIYQWRGSDINGILTFADRYRDVNRVTLDDNFRSSSGIVEVGRSIAERNNPNRLTKHMVASGHQGFDEGDILALTFESPAEEASWIAERILHLRGTCFNDGPDPKSRGLSWSDFAVLLRSVSRNAAPIVAAFKAADIPYVVGGVNNLFDAPEIAASVALFEYVVGARSDSEVVALWLDAGVGRNPAILSSAIRVLDEARDFSRGQRWSTYNLQRTYLAFLEEIKLREQDIPVSSGGNPRGEVVFYNLGKFSQVISDFEQVNYKMDPARKYEDFVHWLHRDAPDSYEEGGADAAFATPDAVQILTVHRSKGLQWPVVFVPALQGNRFPSGRHGGRTIWHLIPRDAVRNPDRYDGSVGDERRLFYVAATRSQKYLYLSCAPGESRAAQGPSEFHTEVAAFGSVLTEATGSRADRCKPSPIEQAPEITLSFSDLKFLFECPYQFKLRLLYGFNPPIHEAIGYGKSLHDCMAEIHKRALGGELVDPSRAVALVDEHLHVPFAYPQLKNDLREAAIRSVQRYLSDNGEQLLEAEHVEKAIELVPAPGITVKGRIDLIRRLDSGDVAIVDFKSTERAQDEDVTRQQLHVYAMGYRELTGTSADLIEVHNLDSKGKGTRELVDTAMLAETSDHIVAAGDAIRNNALPRLSGWCDSCARCDLAGICRSSGDGSDESRQ